jgi:hypothetical protein
VRRGERASAGGVREGGRLRRVAEGGRLRLLFSQLAVVGADAEVSSMCRNIRILFNFEPPVTEAEIHAAALQYVRKVSGFNKPSTANEVAFQTAIGEIAAASDRLLRSLKTNSPAKNREEEAAKARARNAERFSQ